VARSRIKICCVIVTFNPDISVLKRLTEILEKQVDYLVVVDNSIDTEWTKDVNLNDYISLGENKGLAYAHNVGIDIAKKKSATHVLFMDQDSVPSEQMTRIMLDTYMKLESSGKKVGAIGARYVGTHAGNQSYFVRFGWFKFKKVFCEKDESTYVAADFLISSGTLIPLFAITDVGKMEEGLFIDHVDTEWFLRAKTKGYEFYGSCAAVMEHGLGEDTYKIWLGRWRYLPKHKPFRYYYIFRNSILLYKRPYATKKWIVNDISRLVFMVLFYGLVTTPRLEKLRMMLKGFKDGIRGLSGPVVKPTGA